MNDYHGVYDGEMPDWLDGEQAVFVREGGFGWASDDYGPILAKMVNWTEVSSFRIATAETTYR